VVVNNKKCTRVRSYPKTLIVPHQGKNKFLFIDFGECYPIEDLTLTGVLSAPTQYNLEFTE
jgi:hypothetical protein